ncbi:MAG: COX15/CtaA family protein [Polyangiales bacterium]
MSPERFKKLAIATLVVTLAVILWGAFVRASGSGAGCGSHWPTCNGEVIPRAKSVATLIEYTHRVTSGTALILTIGQLVAAFFAFPRGHLARKGAALSMFFMVTEAAVGAGLVLFEMVAQNKSFARAYWMGAHLSNTFFLLASMALTIWWASDRPAPRFSGARAWVVGALGAALLAVGMAGAIVALGDTLFPVKTLGEGIAQDFSAGAHFFIRLRALHPVLAILVGSTIFLASRAVARTESLRRLAAWLGVAFGAQLAVGVLNLVLLAPVALQLVHLLLADLYWMAAVIFASAYLAEEPAYARPAISNRSASTSASVGQ